VPTKEEGAAPAEETGEPSAPAAELEAEVPAKEEGATPAEETIEPPTGEAATSDETADSTEKEVKEDNA
jgi:hypothetical protein